MNAPDSMAGIKAAQLNTLIRSLPETQQEEIRDIFSWFVVETSELYALIDTAALAFEGLRLTEGAGLARVLFMVTNRTYDIEAALKAVAEDQEVDDE
jgi:hypothetical protein